MIMIISSLYQKFAALSNLFILLNQWPLLHVLLIVQVMSWS